MVRVLILLFSLVIALPITAAPERHHDGHLTQAHREQQQRQQLQRHHDGHLTRAHRREQLRRHHDGHVSRAHRSRRYSGRLNPRGFSSFRQHSENYCTYMPWGSNRRVQTPCYGGQVIQQRPHHDGHVSRARQPQRRGRLNPRGFSSFRQHSENYCTYTPWGSNRRVQTPCYGGQVIQQRPHHDGHVSRARQPQRRGRLNPKGFSSFRQHGPNYCTYKPYDGGGRRVQTPCY